MQDEKPAAQPGTAIIVGTGRIGGLSARIAAAQRAILVEADPERARTLARAVAELPRVTLVAAALAPVEGEAPFNVFNVEGLGSLKASAGLEELYPGLRVLRRPVVPLLSPERLLAENEIPPGPLTLALDAPGSEAAVLQSLHESGNLERFSRIELLCSADGLFEGGKPAADLAGLLTEAGFALHDADRGDPDWPVLTFTLDVQALRIRRLEKERADTAQRSEALQAELGRSTAAAAALQTQLSELEATHKALVAKADWRHARIRELEATLTQETAARTQAEATVQAHAARIAELETEATLATAERERLDLVLNQEGSARSAAEAATQAHMARLVAMEGEAAALTAESERLECELGEARSALATAEAATAATVGERDRLAADLQVAQKAQADSAAAAETRYAELSGKLTTLEVEHKALIAKSDWRNGRIRELTAAAEVQTAAQKQLEEDLARSGAAQAAAATREAELGSQLAQLEEQRAKLSSELDTKCKQIEGLEVSATEAASRRDALAGELVQLRATLANAEAESRKRVAEMTTKLVEVEANHKAANDKAEWRSSRIRELDETNGVLRQEHERARADLALALRMQSLCAGDLSDLRSRHAVLQDQKDRQDVLISQLIVRLEEASGYLKQLAATPAAAEKIAVSASASVASPEHTGRKSSASTKRKKK